jgi:hypothetical protein
MTGFETSGQQKKWKELLQPMQTGNGEPDGGRLYISSQK